MKLRVGLSSLLVVTALAMPTLAASRPNSNLEPRVAALEAKVADLQVRVAALEAAESTSSPTPVPGPTATPTPTPGPTPNPTPTPASSPAPTSDRPFPAPQILQTATVPASIDATGGSDAGVALRAFIGQQPDNTRISFPSGGVFRLDRGISLVGRHHLVIDLNGSTLRANGPGGGLVAASPIVLDGGNTDIAIVDGVIEGNNPKTGTDIYGGGEDQQGIAIYGDARIELAQLTIRKTWGDGVYVNQKDTTLTWATDVWIHDNALRLIGRQAFTVNGGRRVLIERNNVDQVGMMVLDIEPDTNDQGVDGVTFRSNTAGTYGLNPAFTQWFTASANQSSGTGASVRNVTIANNTVTGGAPASANTPASWGGLASWFGRPSRMANITFTGNSTTKAGVGPVLRFERIDGLTITGNTQPLTSGQLASIADSTNVTYVP